MKRKIDWLLVHLELIVMVLIVLIPIIWIIMSSLNPGDGLASVTFFPKQLSIHSYVELFRQTNYALWFMNTLEIAVVNMVASVFLILITAWIVSRFPFRGKKVGMISFLLMSMFPSFLSMTAYFVLFLTLGLLNHPLALVIIYATGAIPYNVWLVKGYLDGISKEIEEAAYMDGCSYMQTFFRIVIPMSMPIITYCAVSQFMLPWMDYMIPNMLLSGDQSKTLALGLYSLIYGEETSRFTMFAAGAVLIAVPITILFILFQKFLVQGIAAGANKE